jgi:hypothetical protein
LLKIAQRDGIRAGPESLGNIGAAASSWTRTAPGFSARRSCSVGRRAGKSFEPFAVDHWPRSPARC